MAYEKRKRSANWMPPEKLLLVDLVAEHFHVIENKRTDGVSMKQKLGEWLTISAEYNSQTMFSHRTADNLKAQWESLKKSAKKEASLRRKQLIQTGGGPQSSVIEDPIKQKILCLIMPSDEGSHNPFDSDNSTLENKTYVESWPGESLINVTDTVAGTEVQNKYSTDSAASSAIPIVIKYNLLNENKAPANKSPHPQVLISHNDTSSERTNTDSSMVDWGDYTLKNLKTPISNPLECSTEAKRRPTGGIRLEWISKRRHAAKEKEANELFHIQMDIQREILKQEKIKTRLLLLELRRKRKKK